jgi:hypothetical protein
MTNIITPFFKLNTSEQFLESFDEPSSTRMYMFIGRVTPFANDSSPPSITNTQFTTQFDIYRDMIAMKRINSADTIAISPRYNWTNNTVYTEYDDNTTNLFDKQFYVLTSENNVYKCIDNNRGRSSTQEPSGTSTSTISTSDGYRWKFLYAITTADAQKFLTSTYIPVRQITANNGSAQWSIQQAASNGSIEHIRITANGSGYLNTSNTFLSITNSTVVRLSNNALQIDGVYTGSTIYVSSGLGLGQLRRVVKYVGTGRIATVNGAFTITPNTSSRYIIAPNIIIRGDSGATESIRATAYVSNCLGGQIRKITMVTNGRNYGQANVIISANSIYGSGATARAVISPRNGHGSNARNELNAKNIMMSISVSGNESNTFPTNNDFRTVGIIRDPKLRSGPAANASVIDQCHRIIVQNVSRDYTADEIVTGSISGAKARVVYFANTNAARTKGVLRVIRVSPNGTGRGFSQTETLTATSSGATATIINTVKPTIRENTGDVLYIESNSPIVRKSDQLEEFRFVVTF